MARILLIDTATARLSIALAEKGKIVASRTCDEPRRQASLTAPLVQEVLHSQGLGVADCDAVCVSSGPGSYTGLRVGVSTAKGLSFGAGIPLIAVGTLDILASNHNTEAFRYIVPMIDARRMEVYTAVYSADGRRLTPVEAKVIGPDSFARELAQGPVLFTGDGALKCREVITHPHAQFQESWPDVAAMAILAQKAWEEKRFEDIAYFEPFYLKDFVATVSRKKLF